MMHPFCGLSVAVFLSWARQYIMAAEGNVAIRFCYHLKQFMNISALML